MLKKLLILSVFSFSVFAQAKQSLIEMVEKKASAQEIQAAIQQGADVNEREGIFSKKRSVLIIAIENKRPEVAKLLVSYGADVNAKDEDGDSILILAAFIKEVALAKALIQAGADVNVKGEYEKTALMRAVQFESLEMARLLLQAGADVNAKDEDGNPALHHNASSPETFYGRNHKLEMVKLLVSYGADVNAKNKARGTALMLASLYGYSNIVKLLLAYGADVNARDEEGKTALHFAYKEDGFWSVVPKKDYQGTVQALLQAGATQ